MVHEGSGRPPSDRTASRASEVEMAQTHLKVGSPKITKVLGARRDLRDLPLVGLHPRPWMWRLAEPI